MRSRLNGALAVEDRRPKIVEAGLAILREDGLPGFTQPRVARRAGMRQSHLTYYYPTRLDLLTAVALSAVDAQLAGLDAVLDGSSVTKAAQSIAIVMARPENTRVLLALIEGADSEPVLRDIFNKLDASVLERSTVLLQRLGIKPTQEKCAMIRSLSVGLAVLNLARGLPDAQKRTADVIKTALTAMRAAERK